MIETVWIVGTKDCEGTWIRYVCRTEAKALERWDELRKVLLDEAEDNYSTVSSEAPGSMKMYERMIDNLSQTDPVKMDNFPHEAPFMIRWEVDE